MTLGGSYISTDFNLLGLWFTEAEVYAMLSINLCSISFSRGRVREQLEPLKPS